MQNIHPSANGGPRSEEGKATSTRNATKHGCCSTETHILATESHDEFKSLKSKAEAEIHLIDQLVAPPAPSPESN